MTRTTVEGTVSATDLSLEEDFTADWLLSDSSSDKLAIITHRDPHTPLPSGGEPVVGSRIKTEEPGFFEAQLLIASPQLQSKSAVHVPQAIAHRDPAL